MAGIKMSQFLRQLSVLAALQMMLGEPQLCSLVILESTGIPGDGFCWTVGLNASAPMQTKKAAHAHEVDAVRRFRWRPSDDKQGLPW